MSDELCAHTGLRPQLLAWLSAAHGVSTAALAVVCTLNCLWCATDRCARHGLARRGLRQPSSGVLTMARTAGLHLIQRQLLCVGVYKAEKGGLIL
jgi:hypothetical protein